MNSSLGDVTARNERKMVPAVLFISQLFYAVHAVSVVIQAQCHSSDNEGIPAEKSALIRMREDV